MRRISEHLAKQLEAQGVTLEAQRKYPRHRHERQPYVGVRQLRREAYEIRGARYVLIDQRDIREKQ